MLGLFDQGKIQIARVSMRVGVVDVDETVRSQIHSSVVERDRLLLAGFDGWSERVMGSQRPIPVSAGTMGCLDDDTLRALLSTQASGAKKL